MRRQKTVWADLSISFSPHVLRLRSSRTWQSIGIMLLGLLWLSALIILSACGQVTSMGDMHAEGKIGAGGAAITNLNDFPWYGLVVTINEKYSNRLLMDKGNWPFLRYDSVVMPGEVERIVFEGNFVHSDDDYLDPDDTWWENIPYTIAVEKIRLEAKSKINGSYDLIVTLTTKNGSP